MPQIQWSDSLASGLASMDETHREFITLYNLLAGAGPEEFLARMDAFIDHTQAHFDQENRWMEAVNFPGCHRAEHDRVLAVTQDVRKRVEQGDLFLGKRLVDELPAWFDSHVNGMDAALAFHLESIGFDVTTGAFRDGGNAPGAGQAKGCACVVPDEADTQQAA
ncbi:MAG: bacteriohemerythrin [Rhodocyclaceae bacterium]|nr:bacteriohemerythrin [Rhodocyclaceae bacterium]